MDGFYGFLSRLHYNVVKNWVSRFKIWPYLETFAEDSATELLGEFQGRPDLVIGNYSDGNLVALYAFGQI